MLQILRKDLLEIELTKNIDFYLKAISYLLMSIFFYVCVFLNKFLFPPPSTYFFQITPTAFSFSK